MNIVRRAAGAVAALLGAGMLMLGTAMPAAAHANLVDVTPSAGTVVQTPPRFIRLRFSEPVQATDGSASVIAPNGEQIHGVKSETAQTNGSVLVVGLPADLPDGTYQVSWRVISLDTHPVQGSFNFAVGSPSSPLTQGPAASSVGPSLLGGAGRAAAVAGALSVAGLIAFPLLVLGPARRRLRTRQLDRDTLWTEALRRLRLPLVLACAVTIAGTCGVLLDDALSTQTPLLETSTSTRAGQLLLVRILSVLVATGVATVGVRRMPSVRRLTIPLLASAAMLTTFSLSSHAAASVADRPIALAFDLAHLLVAGVWIGGLLGLAIAAMPAAAATWSEDREGLGEAAFALTARFSVVAQLAMVGVLITGVYATLLQVSDLPHLQQTAWGVALTAKLALWVSVLVFAAANAVTFVPALAGRAGGITRRMAAVGQLRSATRVEIGLAAALIVVAALMSATEPPEQQLAADRQEAAVNHVETTRTRAASSGYVARIRTSRTGIGDGAATVFEVGLRSRGSYVTLPKARSRLTSDSGIRREVSLHLEGVGRWSSELLPIVPGRYHLVVSFGALERARAFPVDVRVAAPPPAVVAAARVDPEADARARAQTALATMLAAIGLLAGLAALGLGLRRSARRKVVLT